MKSGAVMTRAERYGRALTVYRATSGEAWRSVLDHLAAVDAAILVCVAEGLGTCDAIELATGMKHQTVSAQIRHLTEAGLLEDSGERQATRSGRAATVWALAARRPDFTLGNHGAQAPTLTWPVVEWHGCYDEQWRGVIVDAAFAHPAKMSRGLLRRIFDHLIAIGALQKGDRVLDPFGGIGTTSLEGVTRGMQVVSCELEPRFFDLAQQNFALHARTWEQMGWPQPVIVNGDSRQLTHNIRHVVSLTSDAVISSPPYAEIATGAGGLNTKPPKHEGQQGGRSASAASQDTDQRYGDTPGQLAKLPKGGVDAVVSSPPFTQGYQGGGGINKRGYNPDGGEGADKVGDRSYQGTGAEREAGNLETMTLGDVAAVVEQRTGDTFWHAALDIVRESYAILRPGGTAAWVVKAFVRNKQIVDFPGDWRRLCEHVGFEMVTEVHAMLVEETTHGDLFDGEVTTRRERKSFFRRLQEKRGSPRIDFEVVIIMRKPA